MKNVIFYIALCCAFITRNLPYTVKIIILQPFIRKFSLFLSRYIPNKYSIISFDNDKIIEVSIKQEFGRELGFFGYHHYEESLFIKNTVLSDWIVFDIGANLGDITIILSKYAKEVHSFEPHPEVNKRLNKNVKLNELNNVIVNKLALSSEKGLLDFWSPPKVKKDANEGLFSLVQIDGFEKIDSVQAITLDDYVSANSIDRLDFIKIDVEGAEKMVFIGAENTLHKYSPIIMLEINDPTARSAGYSVDDLLSFLENQGYNRFFLFNLAGGLNVAYKNEILKRASNGSFNIIAIKS